MRFPFRQNKYVIIFRKLLLKLLVLACVIVLVETTNAKMRLFRVPELLAVAFTLAALALASTFLF